MQFRRIQLPQPTTTLPSRKITKRHWLRVLLYSAIALPVIALGAAVYLIWFSPHFVIDYVDIVGANGLDMTGVRKLIFSQMDQPRYKIFPQRLVWFFDTEAARHSIWEEYAISQLSIEKRSPNTLKINVFEEPFQAIWYTKGKYYKVDGRGVIIKEVDADLLSDVPYQLPAVGQDGQIPPVKNPPSDMVLKSPGLIYIQDQTNADVAPGTNVLSQSVVASISELKDKLSPAQVSIYYISTKPQEHDIEVVTTEKWSIKLNVFEKLDQQVDHLKTVLQDKVKNDRGALSYIDVRFDNRIYIKNK